ncbi:hypothetical protein OHR68_31995 [Spirillospora sp. NBC_00431]
MEKVKQVEKAAPAPAGERKKIALNIRRLERVETTQNRNSG